MNIKESFNTEIAKKILAKKDYAIEFLISLNEIKRIPIKIETIKKGKNKGIQTLKMQTDEIWKSIVEHWDYENGLKIIRSLFKKTPKYSNGLSSYESINTLKKEWEKLKLKEFKWPFSQGDFDGFVQRINSQNGEGTYKDQKVKEAAVKYRRIKEINTLRNDYIETLIFNKNKNILPTLNHRKGVDFFIDGIPYDQKVAKGPTKQFMKKYGENYKEKAIQSPEEVAKFLYQHQDEGRFGSDSRLLIVYLNEDISTNNIGNIIKKTNLEDPLEVTFNYKHKINGKKHTK